MLLYRPSQLPFQIDNTSLIHILQFHLSFVPFESTIGRPLCLRCLKTFLLPFSMCSVKLHTLHPFPMCFLNLRILPSMWFTCKKVRVVLTCQWHSKCQGVVNGAKALVLQSKGRHCLALVHNSKQVHKNLNK